MRFTTTALAATLLANVQNIAAFTGKAYPWDKPIGASMICGTRINPTGTFEHGHPWVALFPDTFTGYSVCNRWVRINNNANGQYKYGMVVDQEGRGWFDDLHLSYTFYSEFAFVGTNPYLNITWEWMPVGWTP
ncbi:hypothetical protein BKA70DRAFT_1265339 [Coprinopsis sp. MPI-PUGE-AT-0042]|nr:hypothetical protein BKA70DRAFT_1265339 [Coprinopsis sp. MPI-PUGE-AT-0042]